MTLKSLPLEDRESFASKMCIDSKEVYEGDQWNKRVGKGLAWGGAGLGVALMFTGVGAPLGACLFAMDTSLAQ